MAETGSRRRRYLWGLPDLKGIAELLEDNQAQARPRTPESWKRHVLAREGRWCNLCGKRVAKGHEHFDHGNPLSRGGTHSLRNIHVTHERCNLEKGTMTTSEYRRWLRTLDD